MHNESFQRARGSFSLGVLIVLALLMVAGVPSTSNATEVPPYLSHQGVLTDSNGVMVADGLYALTFTIFDAPSAGNELFSQQLDVQVTGGLYNVLLSDGGGPGTLAEAFENPTTYLEIAIVGVPQGSPITPPETLAPRQKFASVPYAMVAPSNDLTRVLVESRDVNNDHRVNLVLPAEFDRFEIEVTEVYPVDTSPVEFQARLSTDGGATWHKDASYAWVLHFIRSGYHGHDGANSDSRIRMVKAHPNEMFKNAAGKALSGSVTILSRGDGNAYPTILFESAHFGGDLDELVLTNGSGQLVAPITNRIDAIQFRASSGNLAGGRFRVYGLR